MERFYLSYRLKLEEPLIVSNGSQIGNVLQTQDYIPGSSMLGVCAGLYVRSGADPMEESCGYSDEFRSLFLSEQTIFSPAYPLAQNRYKTFPMPLSVLGCKYYGINEPTGRGRNMHGFADYLHKPVPERCPTAKCGATLEHKTGFCYLADPRSGYCNLNVSKQIISHNQVSEEPEDKRLFSFESLAEDQQFCGEISFSNEQHRNIIHKLLPNDSVVKLGKAKSRGYGRVRIFSPMNVDRSVLDEFTGTAPQNGGFSLYLFSDTILVDRNLNYCTAVDKENLAFWLGLNNPDGLTVHLEPENKLKSFYKDGVVLGFNQHRRMPLPMEKTILRGSVFNVEYSGKAKDLEDKLKSLQMNGLGLRRNEGFGMVVINHRIHEG